MSTIKRGIIKASKEWAKHLRKFGRREFWRKNRQAFKKDIQERRIDLFLAGWGGLKESRDYARYYLEESNWDVSLAQDRYWRENILIY